MPYIRGSFPKKVVKPVEIEWDSPHVTTQAKPSLAHTDDWKKPYMYAANGSRHYTWAVMIAFMAGSRLQEDHQGWTKEAV